MIGQRIGHYRILEKSARVEWEKSTARKTSAWTVTRLAAIGKLLPRPTSAILRYENQNPDLKQAGRDLASEYVLTAIIHDADERLRVSSWSESSTGL